MYMKVFITMESKSSDPKISVNVGTTVVMIHCNPEEEPEIRRKRGGSLKSISKRKSRSPNRLSGGNQNLSSPSSTSEDISPKLTLKNTSINMEEIRIVEDDRPTENSASGSPIATYQNPAFEHSIESLNGIGRLRRQISYTNTIDSDGTLACLECIPAKFRQRDHITFLFALIALPIVIALVFLFSNKENKRSR
ncbi:uncharacterized protein [Diabrotica undecimpunctata]|uniref:uncharacterized protein isoform X2 n=1 Tax=Diabrotica undecimpunctata TaxID=50387 RepID=UPI003B635121